MVRSLYCGISGLRNHQVAMDVTGNNIANVNTTGFKSGRVTFEESMAQLLKGASRPPGNAGGTNPMQVGLGMGIGSVDTILTQGNLQSTGQITDLALEGRAYFVYSNSEETLYSRMGGLQMDSAGRLVSPTNGYSLQGKMANDGGEYPPGTVVGDIRIPFGQKSPAQATSEVGFACNLDSDSEGLGTVVHSNRFLANATGTDVLAGLFNQNGQDLGMKAGDTLTITASDEATPPNSYSATVNVDNTTTLADLATAIQNMLTTNIDGAITTTVAANGAIQVNMAVAAPGTEVNNLSVRSDRPGSNSYVSNLFNWGPTLAAGTTTASVGTARAAADENDLLSTVYDAAGNTLGLEDDPVLGPDIITVNGAVGGNAIAPRPVSYNAAMTLGTLLTEVRAAFNLPERDGTLQNNLSVEMDDPNTDDNRIPDGSIVVRGQPEENFAITNVSITATNRNNNNVSPTRFNANSLMTEIQAARDTGVHSTSIVVYDESGDAHTMTTTFTHSGTPGEWLWEITMESGESIVGGNTGHITFGQDGSPSSFTFSDGSTSFRFDPMNGSNEVEVRLDVGSPGSFSGITQFRSPSTTAAREQNGYAMGKLQEISIDEFGEITGLFTNGANRSIAQIYVADFNNPAGLLKVGDSMYAKSNNSGEAVMLRPNIGSSTKIKPGALEMSNVDLATEFTNMITTQRGYQANARVITTSDTLLQELVQLVR
jgi:flagellar hook protein FlgE